jgi:hypothetical protein
VAKYENEYWWSRKVAALHFQHFLALRKTSHKNELKALTINNEKSIALKLNGHLVKMNLNIKIQT